ncbi:f7829521-82ad-494f-b9a9-f3ff23f8bad2 [Thermothielavioides terrestris]|jgi:hypothetical protein
MKVR